MKNLPELNLKWFEERFGTKEEIEAGDQRDHETEEYIQNLSEEECDVLLRETGIDPEGIDPEGLDKKFTVLMQLAHKISDLEATNGLLTVALEVWHHFPLPEYVVELLENEVGLDGEESGLLYDYLSGQGYPLPSNEKLAEGYGWSVEKFEKAKRSLWDKVRKATGIAALAGNSIFQEEE